MTKLFIKLGLVPLWVWLFLSMSQAGNIFFGLSRLSNLDGVIESLSYSDSDNVEFQSDAISHFRTKRFRERISLVASSLLLPTFVVMAHWKWKYQRLAEIDGIDGKTVDL
jgi:hypothetical protein